jgi:hypothetical protein
VEALYFGYRLGKPGSSQALIDGVWQYIEPVYETMVNGALGRTGDYIWARFIGHYSNKSVIKAGNLKLLGKANNYAQRVENAADYIHRLFKGVSKQDIKQAMLTTVIDMARTYRHKGTPNFLFYLSMYYTRRLQSCLEPLIHDYTHYGAAAGQRDRLKRHVAHSAGFYPIY